MGKFFGFPIILQFFFLLFYLDLIILIRQICYLLKMVDVAQLAEPQVVVLVVAGSSPVIHPQYYIKYVLSPSSSG